MNMEELPLEEELGKLMKKSAKKVAPQIERFERAVGTAIKSGAKDYLRENGITQELLSDEEYDFLISAIERTHPADSPNKIGFFAKNYCYRQLRRIHNPRKTAIYLHYSFRDTFIYFLFFTLYMVLVYTSCHHLSSQLCILSRIIMTFHLGYFNALWAKRIIGALYIQFRELMYFFWNILRFMPAIFFETSRVLFDVFIGWPLLGSIFGIFFMLYIMPIAFPEMGLSSVFIEIYTLYIGEIPGWVRVVTMFI